MDYHAFDKLSYGLYIVSAEAGGKAAGCIVNTLGQVTVSPVQVTVTINTSQMNVVEHWDDAVEEVGEPMAKLWGLYMGACQYGFEHNKIQLHQILAVRLGDTMTWDVPLRPWWQA